MTEVEIHGIGSGGAGVGRLPDGRVVFVQRTAPGDLATVEITRRKKSWARAKLLELKRPGEGRREAPCPHYDRCGGCTLEHLEYPYQLRAKAELVRDALARIGDLDIDIPEIVASPSEFRYRNRVAFTLRRLSGGRVVAGFHELDNPGRIMDTTGSCLLPEPAIAAAWNRLRQTWGPNASRLPSGPELRLTLRGTESEDVVLIIDGGYAGGRAEELLERVDALAAVHHKAEGAEDYRLLAGEEPVSEQWRGETIHLGPDTFVQVNRGAAALLEEYVMDRAGDVSGTRVVDAYCGIGLYARATAAAGATAVGLERNRRATAEAERDAPEGATFLLGPVEERLAETLPADLVILNPPRTGVEQAVVDQLRERPPARLIYVSCDPATLARDLQRLGGIFKLRSVRCFDLFPQTAHVESVVELECATTST